MKSPIKLTKKKGRLNLFFMEMIIVLLFFSIASAVILCSFAGSDKLAKDSRLLESAVFRAQSAAEIYSQNGSLSKTAGMLFPSYTAADGELSRITVPVDGKMYMIMSETSEECGGGILKKLSIIFRNNDGETVYETETGAYISERAVTEFE